MAGKHKLVRSSRYTKWLASHDNCVCEEQYLSDCDSVCSRSSNARYRGHPIPVWKIA